MTDDILVVSWSEIDTARQCFHKHQLGYRERWQQSEQGTGNALSRGILWHEVMEAHYRWAKTHLGRSTHTDDEIRTIVVEDGWEFWITEEPLGRRWYTESVLPLLYDPTGAQNQDQVLIEWMLQGYIAKWGFDQHWKILAIEHGVEYPLIYRDGTESRYRLKTKIDLIVSEMMRGRPKRWLVDHKSGKDLPRGKDLDLADQFALYEHSLKAVGKPVFGTLHNAARTQRNQGDLPAEELAVINANRKQPFEPQPLDKRHLRTPMSRGEIELDTIAEEAIEMLDLAWSFEGHNSPRSPDEDRCGWRCSYTEACLAGRKGLDERDFLMRKGFQINKERH